MYNDLKWSGFFFFRQNYISIKHVIVNSNFNMGFWFGFLFSFNPENWEYVLGLCQRILAKPGSDVKYSSPHIALWFHLAKHFLGHEGTSPGQAYDLVRHRKGDALLSDYPDRLCLAQGSLAQKRASKVNSWVLMFCHSVLIKHDVW